MITVYTTDTCGYCPMVKQYLKLKNIEFQEVNVTTDSETRAKLFERTKMMTVPVTVADDNSFVVGWNAGKLAQLIANSQAQAV